jgi:excisionase family DNA binding protein
MIIEVITKDDLKELVQKIDRLEDLMNSMLSQIQTKVNEPENLYITRKELAEKLRLTVTTIDKLSKEGKLKAYRLGGRIRYKTREVERAMEEIKNAKYKR